MLFYVVFYDVSLKGRNPSPPSEVFGLLEQCAFLLPTLAHVRTEAANVEMKEQLNRQCHEDEEQRRSCRSLQHQVTLIFPASASQSQTAAQWLALLKRATPDHLRLNGTMCGPQSGSQPGEICYYARRDPQHPHASEVLDFAMIIRLLLAIASS